MISFDEALAIIANAVKPLGTERVPLERASGRVLSSPVIAAIDSPRADVSAMDGYAVHSSCLSNFPVSLRVAGESFPGAGWSGVLEPSACVRIFTGAPLPPGADRVIIQEEVDRDGATATITRMPSAQTWVRAKGRDFRAGDEVLATGRRLDPSALIAAGGADCAELEVFARPRLALVVTGDELVKPGEAHHRPLAVPDSVTVGLAAFAMQWGAEAVECVRLGDDIEAMRSAASGIVHLADVIVVTGGASVGERDYAKAMFERVGLELLFSKISIRPGKPAWLGRIGDKLVLGLPGNPTSALVTARLLLAPLLSAIQGQAAALDWEPAQLASPLPTCDLRETFHRARLSAGAVTLVSFQESHAQKALAAADVLVRQRAHSPRLEAGEIVQVLRL